MKKLKRSVKKSAALAFEKTGLDIVSAISHPRDIAKGIPAISSISLDRTILNKAPGVPPLRRVKSESDGAGTAGGGEKVVSERTRHVPPPPTSAPPLLPASLTEQRGNLSDSSTGASDTSLGAGDDYWDPGFGSLFISQLYGEPFEEPVYIDMSAVTVTVQESEQAVTTTAATAVTTETVTVATTAATTAASAQTATTITFQDTVDPEATTLLDSEMDQSRDEGAMGGSVDSESYDKEMSVEAALAYHGLTIPMSLLVYRELNPGLKKLVCEIIGVGSLEGLIGKKVIYDDSVVPEVETLTSTPIGTYGGSATPRRPRGTLGDTIGKTPSNTGFESPAFSLSWEHEQTRGPPTQGPIQGRSRLSMVPLSAAKHLYPSHEMVQNTLMEPLLSNRMKPDLGVNVP